MKYDKLITIKKKRNVFSRIKSYVIFQFGCKWECRKGCKKRCEVSVTEGNIKKHRENEKNENESA